MRLRTGLHLACVTFALLLTLTGAVPLPRPTERVYADNNLEQLCVPERVDVNGGHFAPTDWIQVAFINRATLKVQFVGESSCRTPSGQKFPFIHSNGKKFQDVAGGNYYDYDTVSGEGFDYRRRSDAGSRDNSRVDQFQGAGPSDPFGGKDAKLEDGQIRSMTATAEFTFGIEEDDIGSGVTCEGGNNNFTINSGDNIWRCASDVSGIRGYRIAGKMSGYENFNITYNYQGGQVVHVSEDVRAARTFSWCDGANGGAGQFRTEDCGGDLYLDGVTEQQMKDLKEGRGEFLVRKDGDSRSFSVVVAGSESASAGATPPPGADESGGSAPSCESEGGPVAWILCPVVDGLLSVLDRIAQGPLKDLLRYDSLTSDDSNGAFLIWRNFVRIANVLFVIAFMIIIFSQALSLNIDAYTIRRMLPRVVVGIILVQLSFYLAVFAVDVFNVLGEGVAGLILGPIEGFPKFQALILPLLDDSAGGQVFSGGVLGFLGAANFAALAGTLGALIWAAIAILPTVLFVILAVVMTLIFRNAIIALCVVLSPIALVAWILPNTERIFRQWTEVFLKSLVMYPLIMAFLAIGKFAGALIVEDAKAQNGSGEVFNTIASILVNIVPYLLIPFSYKLAGRALGTVGNMFLKARGFRGLGGGAGGGKGGGGGGVGGKWRQGFEQRRIRMAAGQGRLGRFKAAQLLSQRPQKWTLNPLSGFKPGQLRPSNLRRDPRQALRGAFGGATPRAQWQRQRGAAGGAAEEQFSMLESAARKRLEDSGLASDKDAMEAIRLGKRGVAMLRGLGRHKDADKAEQLQQRYAQLMKPEYEMAATMLSIENGFINDPDGGSMSTSDAKMTYDLVAEKLSHDPAQAAKRIGAMAFAAGAKGRHAQAILGYDTSSGRVRYTVDRAIDPSGFTDDQYVAMQDYLSKRSAIQLANTHVKSVPEVSKGLEDNLRDPRHADTAARQVGELLVSPQLHPEFRARLDEIYAGVSDPTSPTYDPSAHALIDQTMQDLRNP